jgi:hypothetical protein
MRVTFSCSFHKLPVFTVGSLSMHALAHCDRLLIHVFLHIDMYTLSSCFVYVLCVHVYVYRLRYVLYNRNVTSACRPIQTVFSEASSLTFLIFMMHYCSFRTKLDS